MSSEFKLAFVGCGGIATHHLRAVRENPSIQVSAAIDPVRERADAIAAETGAQVFSTLAEGLAQGDFDAVDLMLPHDLHEALAIQCFEAGKHVLLEKPMATTLDACARILAAAEKAGTVFMVAENAQYWPEIITARQLIHDGRIGEVVTARTSFTMDLAKIPSVAKEPWRSDKMRTGGGIMIDGASHWLRPMRMWMGEIVEVVAALGHPLEEMEGESLAHAVLRFESGKTGAFHALRYSVVNEPDPWWRVTGTSGEIIIDEGCARGVVLYEPEHPKGVQVHERRGYEDSFTPELLDFSRSVLDGKALEAGPEEALGELRVALAMYRSAQTKQWEPVWT